MKKVFKYATMVAAIAMMTLMSSCKNNDKDPMDVSTGITNKDWTGYLVDQKENGSSWKDMERTKVAIRFNKDQMTPLSGTGYQLEYDDHMSVKDKNAFKWAITGDRINIDYESWTDVFIEFNHDVCVINSNRFSGEMYDGNQHRYLFDFELSPAIDWKQYFK